MSKHVADAEAEIVVVNIEPDFCEVDGEVIPFDISRDLTHEKSNYAKSTFARGEKILPRESVIKGVEGNAGAGIHSGVSQERGDVVTVDGAPKVLVEGRPVSRHDDLCDMNCGS